MAAVCLMLAPRQLLSAPPRRGLRAVLYHGGRTWGLCMDGVAVGQGAPTLDRRIPMRTWAPHPPDPDPRPGGPAGRDPNWSHMVPRASSKAGHMPGPGGERGRAMEEP